MDFRRLQRSLPETSLLRAEIAAPMLRQAQRRRAPASGYGRAEIEADDDGDGDQEYAGVGLVAE
jgi:hypothetical protein